jgi:hypothetical protein
MIQVPKQRLAQVEYLIEQSVRGNHLLFDTEQLRRVFSRAQAKRFVLSEEEAYESEPYIERLLEEDSLERGRAYLQGLEPEVFERVVMTYFCIVENKLFDESGEVRH